MFEGIDDDLIELELERRKEVARIQFQNAVLSTMLSMGMIDERQYLKGVSLHGVMH